MKINIIYSDNSFGLTKDAKIIQSTLKADYNLIDFKQNDNLKKADLNIFLEVLDQGNGFFTEYKKLAPKNILFPNPEWFLNSWIKFLPEFDLVCCKTKDAVRIFKQFTDKVLFASFTSENQNLNYAEKEKSFFHSGGKSGNKGTKSLIEAWTHVFAPHFITFNEKLYLFHKNFSSQSPKIQCSNDYIPEKKFIEIKNKILFHVYPTRYEGFGHNIWESMSTGAIILTTDAPPMNEFNANFYIKSNKGKKHHLAYFNEVDKNDLRKKVKETANLSDEEIIKMINQNIENYRKNDLFFRNTFKKCIKTLS